MSSDPRAAKAFQPREVQWLWRNRIPLGAISIIAGRPDQGKGLIAVHLAAAVSRGADCVHPSIQASGGANVLYSAIEDDPEMMIRPRLEAAGANLDRVFLWRFQVPLQFDELEHHVIERDIRLLIIDPFGAHLGAGINRHSDRVREVTTPLSGLAEKTGMSVVITEHVLKRVAKSAHPLAAIGGSGSGLPAACRMAFIFGVDPDDEDRRVMACVKNNLRTKPPEFAFEIDVEELAIAGESPCLVAAGECTVDARRLLTSDEAGKPGRRPEKRTEAAEWLVLYLHQAGDPVRAGLVIEDGKQHGLSSKTIRRAADDMGVLRNPPKGGRSCTWALPQELKDALGEVEEKPPTTEVSDDELQEWLTGGDDDG